MKLDSHAMVQVTVVVKDIEATARNIADLFGIDVPEVFTLDKLGANHAEYRGVPTDTRVKLAVFKMGAVDFELLQPDDEPSIWKTFLEEHGEGVAQVGYLVQDREGALQALAERGVAVPFWGSYPGGTYHIADTRDLMGVLLNVKHAE